MAIPVQDTKYTDSEKHAHPPPNIFVPIPPDPLARIGRIPFAGPPPPPLFFVFFRPRPSAFLFSAVNDEAAAGDGAARSKAPDG